MKRKFKDGWIKVFLFFIVGTIFITLFIFFAINNIAKKHFLNAQKNREQQNFEYAISEYKILSKGILSHTKWGKKANEEIKETYFEYAKYLFKLGNYESSLSQLNIAKTLLFEKQKEISRLNAEILFAWAKNYENKKEWKNSLSIYQRILNDCKEYEDIINSAKENSKYVKKQLGESYLSEAKNYYKEKRYNDAIISYEKFLQLFPDDPRCKSIKSIIEKIEIDKEVADIMKSEHGELPQAQVTGSYSGTSAIIYIKNSTSYNLTVLYSGPDSKRITLSPSSSTKVTILPGVYHVAARVDSPSVIPFACTDTYSSGSTYDHEYYISFR